MKSLGLELSYKDFCSIWPFHDNGEFVLCHLLRVGVMEETQKVNLEFCLCSDAFRRDEVAVLPDVNIFFFDEGQSPPHSLSAIVNYVLTCFGPVLDCLGSNLQVTPSYHPICLRLSWTILICVLKCHSIGVTSRPRQIKTVSRQKNYNSKTV